MTTRRAAGLAAFLLVLPVTAQADCTAHLRTTASVVSANDAAGLAGSVVAIGTPSEVKLLPVASIHFPIRPKKPGGPYAGLVAFNMAQAGAVRISLGGRAWLDVVRSGATVASVAHRHGAACSGIAKEVTFPLVAGRQVIEITESAAPDVAILLTPTE